MNNLLDNFKLKHEQEDLETVIGNISSGVVFKGTNLWVLIFAIFVASIGLNVNSTAVIIGAMLISPLMGPIMGLGVGMGINNLMLLRKSILNYLFAAGIGLATSTLYFLLSPLNEAHSEILARTSPNVYDVLIAFFGGLAGIVATSSKLKGNVIPGVAIATALMPPLCTAGYGLATFQLSFFFGALYLFLINTVFIALASLITVRFLKFPYHHMPDAKAEIRVKRIVWAIVIVTLLPSIYFAYDIVQQNKFNKYANHFIETEAIFPNDFLLKKKIDAKEKSISLTYGGQKITENEIAHIRAKLKYFNLENATFEINQGFAYINENIDNEQVKQLSRALVEKEKELQAALEISDSLQEKVDFTKQLIKEAKALYPGLSNIALTPLYSANVPAEIDTIYIAYLQFNQRPSNTAKSQFKNWLSSKLDKSVKVIFDN